MNYKNVGVIEPGFNPRNCIFCGKMPEGKTKEHVIPQWLIELTGDKNRTWTFLPALKPGGGDIAFALKDLTFPACETCNGEKSTLEKEAKKVILKLDARINITANEAFTLLDWLDKVRVGLWLGYTVLSKNVANINPKFHINDRVRMKDRVVVVYPYEGEPSKGMNLLWTHTPIFLLKPSCFGIKINRCLYLNLSADYLISRYVGMPFPKGEAKFNKVKNEFMWDGGMTVRESFRDYPKTLGLFKPSIFVGQSIVCQYIFSMWSKKFERSIIKGYIHSSDQLRTTSRIFDFMKNDYLFDEHDLIPFGEIHLDEARKHYEICAQILDIQIRDYLPPCNDIPEFMKDVANFNREMLHNYRQYFRKQVRK